MLALAGTLGVGNIVGVAIGITVGGSGAVLWLVLSALFSSIIKYCEVAIATDSAANGMADVIKASFKKHGSFLSKVYTALCLCLSLSMGTALQSRSIAEAADLALGIKPEYLLLPLIAFLLYFILGGADIIERGVKYIVPLTTGVYTVMCLFVIIPRCSAIGSVISDVFASAFEFNAVSGGFIGIFASAALKEGFARGMLSNEAGAGTSTLAHSRADGRSAFTGGLFGMLEVFFDTVVLCPLTALAILLTGYESGDGGAEIIIKTFSPLLFGDLVILLCILFFAISTVLCWYYYGGACCESLFGKKAKPLFIPLFIGTSAFGLFFSTPLLISASDVLLFLMALITMLTLFKNSSRITELTRNFIKEKRTSRSNGKSS